MLPENAAHAATAEGSAWLRPWRVLLVGLVAVVVASALLAFNERYQFTDGTLTALEADGVPKPLVERLGVLKDKTFESRQLTDAVAGVLSPEERVWYEPLIVERAKVANPVVTPLAMLLMVAGLIVGGWAVKRRLTSGDDEVDERVAKAGLLGVYALYGVIGILGIALPWFSGRIFFGFFIFFTLIGALLVLLPRLWRRLVGTLLIVLHFGGILVAVNCIQATNGQIPWLPMMLNAHIYRPYLSGLYLSNAYHFYAPDPGASTLVWVRIEYADHTARWIKLPSRPDTATPLNYQRQMGISEITTSSSEPISWDELKAKYELRVRAGRNFPGGIPTLEGLAPQAQYSAPGELSQVIMSSIVRHVCRYYPHPTDPAIPPRTVKLYRLTYTIPAPQAVAGGHDLMADDLKLPYYMGEYDTEGRRLRYDPVTLKPMPPDQAEDGEDSPFLFWAIPMNCLHRHAGDPEVESNP
jgi:hypothetical protein